MLGLEKEVHQLRQALAEESHRNARILQLLQDQQQTVVIENGEEDSQLLLRRDEAKLHEVSSICYTIASDGAWISTDKDGSSPVGT